ncbi:MAG TPA: hypothetical protein VHP38_06625 [Ruminiclostridium sp.]|nr:hypothetical protein [Ruminiclostridium sp.]
MKQIIISIAMLAIALALVIGVVVPLMEHGAETGNRSVTEGYNASPRLEDILK